MTDEPTSGEQRAGAPTSRSVRRLFAMLVLLAVLIVRVL